MSCIIVRVTKACTHFPAIIAAKNKRSQAKKHNNFDYKTKGNVICFSFSMEY